MLCSCYACRTVFVTGFPNDVKERELNNMLRFMPGYEASQMNWKNGQVNASPGVPDLSHQLAERNACMVCFWLVTSTVLKLNTMHMSLHHVCTGTRLRPVLHWSCCTCCMHCPVWPAVGIICIHHSAALAACSSEACCLSFRHVGVAHLTWPW
jgi:hypothetical protein